MLLIIRTGFFAFLEDINRQGDGFALFGWVHILALLWALLFIVMISLYARNTSKEKSFLVFRIFVVVALVLEIIRQVSFPLVHGYYWLEHLPLHMCGLALFVWAIHAAKPNQTTAAIAYALCLPGAVAAMLFPDWTLYPIMHFYPLQSFVIHAIHIALACILLAGGHIRPKVRDLWRAVLFLCVILPPIFLFNRRFDTNFFFLNAGSEGSPLEILIDIFGNPAFLIPYMGILLLVWGIMYLPWMLTDKKHKMHENN